MFKTCLFPALNSIVTLMRVYATMQGCLSHWTGSPRNLKVIAEQQQSFVAVNDLLCIDHIVTLPHTMDLYLLLMDALGMVIGSI